MVLEHRQTSGVFLFQGFDGGHDSLFKGNMMNELTTIQPETNNLVSVLDGVPKTSSLVVSRVFGKRHREVLRTIDNLDCSPEFRERNFALSSYKSDTGQQRSYKMYEIARDGFAFLGMGFTGRKAAEFKEKFIDAFNAMEAELGGSAPKKSIVDTIRYAKELGTEFGLEGNQLLLSASHMVKKHHGIDPMEELGITHLINSDQQTHLTPTELGELIGGVGPRQINSTLESLGLQTCWYSTKVKNGKEIKKKNWLPTEAGKDHSVLLDTAKAHSDGTPIQQLKWKQSVVSLLKQNLKAAS